MPRPTSVRAALVDGSFRHLREDGIGVPVCEWGERYHRFAPSMRLEVGPRDGLVPATCLWCVAALMRAS